MVVYTRISRPLPLLCSDNYARYRHPHARFIQELQRRVKTNSDEDITITPPERQLSSWICQGTPIGATGMWYEFGNLPKTWKMKGLRGCTVTFIVCERGFWAGHLWESTKASNINGGSAFLERISATEVRDRNDDLFQRLAVDILEQVTPEDQIANRDYTSLADLEHRYGDPLRNGRGVDVFVLTKAQSATDPSLRYASKVARLVKRYKALLPAAEHTQLTYTGDYSSAGVSAQTSGVISVQYTPYHADSPGVKGRCPKTYAAARVWVETNPMAVIDKTWPTLDRQQVAQGEMFTHRLSSSAWSTYA